MDFGTVRHPHNRTGYSWRLEIKKEMSDFNGSSISTFDVARVEQTAQESMRQSSLGLIRVERKVTSLGNPSFLRQG